MTKNDGPDTPDEAKMRARDDYDADVPTPSPTLYKRARRDLSGVSQDLIGRVEALLRLRYGARNRGALIAEARRLRADVIDVVTLAVLAERASGATWAEVATALSLDERFVVEHYEPIERQWSTGNGIGPILHQQEQGLRLVEG